MGAIWFAIIVVLICAGLWVLFCWSAYNDYVAVGIPAVCLAVVMSFVSVFGIINAFAFVNANTTMDSQLAYRQEQRIMYMDALSAYQELRGQDVTGSETYLNLYKEILSFNRACDKADRYNDKWWAEGLFYDPTYVGIDPVPLRVME